MRVSIDISADQIAIYTPEERIFLERNGVDTTIWPTLVQLDQQSDFSEILLINGPGGFTNLRVGTLAINLLKMLKKSPLQLYSISKIELYQKFFTAEYLPRYGIIYIGQKANLWLRDFLDNQLIQKIKKSELDEYLTQYSEIFLIRYLIRNILRSISSSRSAIILMSKHSISVSKGKSLNSLGRSWLSLP